MKSYKFLILAAALSVSLASGGELARRQESQQRRIAQGVRTGSLTPAEAARLESREAAIRGQLRRDRVDGGRLTAGERARLNRELSRTSRRIHREKTDSNYIR